MRNYSFFCTYRLYPSLLVGARRTIDHSRRAVYITLISLIISGMYDFPQTSRNFDYLAIVLKYSLGFCASDSVMNNNKTEIIIIKCI